jgi:ribose transport system permease protein
MSSTVTETVNPVQAPDDGRISLAARARAAVGTRGYLILVLAGVMVAGTVLSPYFFTSRNLEEVLISASIVAVLAVGQFFVIVTGGIDLSVGSTAALSSVILGLSLQAGLPTGVAIVLALIAAVIVGLINGVVVVHALITPFIATLAMLSIVRGIAFLIQGGSLVEVLSGPFQSIFYGEIGPIQTPILIPIVILVIGGFVMASSSFGRRLYALGGNPEAARLSGLPVDRDRIVVYVVSAFLAGLAGLMIAAQLTEGSARIGTGYELDAIAAVVVGGASLFGGTGDPFSAVVGGLIIAVILNIMNLLGVAAEPQLIITGGVILVAVFFTSGKGRALLGRIPRPRARAAAPTTTGAS